MGVLLPRIQCGITIRQQPANMKRAKSLDVRRVSSVSRGPSWRFQSVQSAVIHECRQGLQRSGRGLRVILVVQFELSAMKPIPP